MHIRIINSIRRYLCEDSTKPLKYYITILRSIFVNCFNGIPQQELSDLHLPHLLYPAEVEQFDMADDLLAHLQQPSGMLYQTILKVQEI